MSANYGGMKAVGLNNVLKEVVLGYENVTLLCDASSAIGAAKISGIGNLRHLHVAYLWLPQKIRDVCMSIVKGSGKVNIDDVFHKACPSYSYG